MLKKYFQILFIIYLTFTIIYCEEEDDTQDDWLHVEDCKIVDKNGNEVWLTGVNWFGFNVGSQVFDGVWSRNMHEMLTEIADHGFNLLRDLYQLKFFYNGKMEIQTLPLQK